MTATRGVRADKKLVEPDAPSGEHRERCDGEGLGGNREVGCPAVVTNEQYGSDGTGKTGHTNSNQHMEANQTNT